MNGLIEWMADHPWSLTVYILATILLVGALEVPR